MFNIFIGSVSKFTAKTQITPITTIEVKFKLFSSALLMTIVFIYVPSHMHSDSLYKYK